MKERLDSIFAFLKTGIWFHPETGLSRPKAFGLKALKVLLLSVRGFLRDQCTVRASALTFYALLSVIPVVAVVFGIAKGFGFDKRLQLQLLLQFPEQSDILAQMFQFSDAMLAKTSGGIVAGIGVAILFWSVIKVLASIEDAFNDIWKVEKGRTIGRKCSDYLSFALVGPVIFIMSSSLTVTVTSQVKYIAKQAAQWGIPREAILLPLNLLPFMLIWVLFAFVLIYMPNAKVRLRSGIIAAIVSGTAYQLTQWFYIAFQVGVARANAIYGSFAALPLFLAWMQISWLIVLMGAEISFAVQNLDTLGFPEGSEKVSPRHGKVLSLLIARLLAKTFAEGGDPPTPSSISHALGVPSPLVHRILSDFSAAGLFTEGKPVKGEEAGWHPARDIHGITVQSVLDALERRGSGELALQVTEDFQVMSGMLENFGAIVEKSAANRPLVDLEPAPPTGR